MPRRASIACGMALTACALLLPGGGAAAAADDLYFADDFSGSGDRAFYEGTLDARVFPTPTASTRSTPPAARPAKRAARGPRHLPLQVTGQISRPPIPTMAAGLTFNYRQRRRQRLCCSSSTTIFIRRAAYLNGQSALTILTRRGCSQRR
jgi:hypothetical protein